MKKNGFTLVELMVIIVIISILAAVAVPKLAVRNHHHPYNTYQGK